MSHTSSRLYQSFDNLYSRRARELGGVKTKAQLFFCRVPGARRRTRWKERSLLLICSLMRRYEMLRFLWRFVLIARQVALHRLWDFMNEWARYQYEEPLKYLVKTDSYLRGGMCLTLWLVPLEFELLDWESKLRRYVKLATSCNLNRIRWAFKRRASNQNILFNKTSTKHIGQYWGIQCAASGFLFFCVFSPVWIDAVYAPCTAVHAEAGCCILPGHEVVGKRLWIHNKQNRWLMMQ